MSLEMGIKDKVDAINVMLEAIGSLGISGEDEIEYNADAGEADNVLRRLSQIVQTNKGKGYWFNRESFHAYTPDTTNGTVSVPQNTLAAYVRISNTKWKQLTLRGYKLFDTESYGYDMTELVESDGKIHLILVVMLEFDYLPTTAKTYIAYASASWFETNMEGDTTKITMLEKLASDALMSLNAENNSHRRFNMFDNPYVKNKIGNMSDYNNVR